MQGVRIITSSIIKVNDMHVDKQKGCEGLKKKKVMLPFISVSQAPTAVRLSITDYERHPSYSL